MKILSIEYFLNDEKVKAKARLFRRYLLYRFGRFIDEDFHGKTEAFKGWWTKFGILSKKCHRRSGRTGDAAELVKIRRKLNNELALRRDEIQHFISTVRIDKKVVRVPVHAIEKLVFDFRLMKSGKEFTSQKNFPRRFFPNTEDRSIESVYEDYKAMTEEERGKFGLIREKFRQEPEPEQAEDVKQPETEGQDMKDTLPHPEDDLPEEFTARQPRQPRQKKAGSADAVRSVKELIDSRFGQGIYDALVKTTSRGVEQYWLKIDEANRIAARLRIDGFTPDEKNGRLVEQTLSERPELFERRNKLVKQVNYVFADIP